MRNKKLNQSYTRASFRIIILLITILLLVLIWSQRGSLGAWSKLGYVGLFVVNFISNATVILPLPGVASVVVAGTIWNPIWVGISSGLGAGLAELIGYFLGYGGRGLVEGYGRKNKIFIRLEGFLRKNAFISVFIFSLIPFPVFDFIGIMAGVISYSAWKFLLAAVSARVIRGILIAWGAARIF